MTTTLDATVRPCAGDGDESALRSIFRDTIALGRPLTAPPRRAHDYEELCLGWYFAEARDHIRVLDAGDGNGNGDGNGVQGYALVCLDLDDHARWTARRARRLAPFALAAACTDPFWRGRVRDAVALRRSPRPAPAHAHLNVRSDGRVGTGARLLRDAIDDVCREARVGSWYGEINAPVGRRLVALERVVGPVVHRAPNHTLTWLTGTPVERLTVVRTVPSR